MKIESPNGTAYNFKIGADPEFFVCKDGRPVSAYGLIPGTKDRPYKVPMGAVQVDGMALEFNIDPADSFTEFDNHMDRVLSAIIKMVPGYEVLVESAVMGGQQVSLPSSVAEFGEAYISSQPKEAKELGCMPDYNAYTKQANPRPNADMPFRTASGHVHIGWTTEAVDPSDEGHLEACRALAKSLDVWLGLPSLLWDKDTKRRELYGQPGAFRPKPYGMEYRVLSNKWITNPLLRKLVYYNTIEAIKMTFNDPDAGDKKYGHLTAKDTLDKKDGWKESLQYAIQYSGIRAPKWYRENQV